MTETLSGYRGYDDSGLLGEMAAGIIVRRYASVDEAAKAVLGEEGGSNVDRLRRKYREQNWYERGLKNYVETEMEKRAALSAASDAGGCHERNDQTRGPEVVRAQGWKSRIEASGKRIASELTPSTTMAFVVLAVTASLAGALQSGATVVLPIFALLIPLSVISLVLWALRSGFEDELHVAISKFVGFYAVVFGFVALFSWIFPDPAFATGSFLGNLLLGYASGAGAMLSLSTVVAYGRRRTRSKEPKEYVVIAMLVAGMVELLSLHPLDSGQKALAASVEVWNGTYAEIEGAIRTMKARDPALDIAPMREAEWRIMRKAYGKAGEAAFNRTFGALSPEPK